MDNEVLSRLIESKYHSEILEYLRWMEARSVNSYRFLPKGYDSIEILDYENLGVIHFNLDNVYFWAEFGVKTYEVYHDSNQINQAYETSYIKSVYFMIPINDLHKARVIVSLPEYLALQDDVSQTIKELRELEAKQYIDLGEDMMDTEKAEEFLKNVTEHPEQKKYYKKDYFTTLLKIAFRNQEKSQEKIAFESGTSPVFLNQIINGAKSCSKKKLTAILLALNPPDIELWNIVSVFDKNFESPDDDVYIGLLESFRGAEREEIEDYWNKNATPREKEREKHFYDQDD